MESPIRIAPNSLAFIALTNEYCQALENAMGQERDEFVARMLKLLPRIYTAANDLDQDISFSDYEIGAYLEEDVYNQIQNNVRLVMAEEDVYLEVFVEDMKYSDSPISATVSENLADLYQEFYNFIASVKDATTEGQQELIGLCKADFKNFWSQTLCNVLRALNTIYYNPSSLDNNY